MVGCHPASHAVPRMVPAVVVAAALLGACSGSPQQMEDAAGVRAEMAAAMALTPLPAEATWQPIELDPGGTYGRGSGRSMVEFQAACAWFDLAVRAAAAEDSPTLARAMAMARVVPTWWSFNDPVVSVDSMRQMVARLVEDAERHDMAAMARFVEVNCR